MHVCILLMFNKCPVCFSFSICEMDSSLACQVSMIEISFNCYANSGAHFAVALTCLIKLIMQTRSNVVLNICPACSKLTTAHFK